MMWILTKHPNLRHLMISFVIILKALRAVVALSEIMTVIEI